MNPGVQYYMHAGVPASATIAFKRLPQYSDTYATASIALASNPSNNDTIQVGSTTYTFKTSLVGSGNNVKRQASLTLTLASFIKAILQTGVAGTDYEPGMSVNTGATAVAFDSPITTVNFTALVAGTAGNSTALVTSILTATVTVFNGALDTLQFAINGTTFKYGVDFTGTRDIELATSLTSAINADRNRQDLAIGAPTLPVRAYYAMYYGSVVRLVSTVPGVIGNSLTLTALGDATAFAISGATFTGGTDAGPIRALSDVWDSTNHFLNVSLATKLDSTNDSITVAGSNSQVVVLASAAQTTTQTQADQTNLDKCGIQVVVVTTAVGTGSITPKIQGKAADGTYYDILVGAAINTNTTTVITVFPGSTVTANVSANGFLPKTWRVIITANNANSATYSVCANLLGNH